MGSDIPRKIPLNSGAKDVIYADHTTIILLQNGNIATLRFFDAGHGSDVKYEISETKIEVIKITDEMRSPYW